MGFAEVAVNSPVAHRRPFSYRIPAGMTVRVGSGVWVPFGSRTLQGVVVELTDLPGVPETRDLLGTTDDQPILTETQVALACWLSERYLSPLFDCLSLMLPPGFERSVVNFVELVGSVPDGGSLDADEAQVVSEAGRHRRLDVKRVEQLVGKAEARHIISGLVKRGVVARTYGLKDIKVKPKMASYARLCISAAEANVRAGELRSLKSGEAQAAAIRLLAECGGALPLVEVERATGASDNTLSLLARRGLLVIERREVLRDPLSHMLHRVSEAPVLTGGQQSACQAIERSLKQAEGAPRALLLFGVTGSGKTEVYLRALETAVSLGRRGIVLVPEISLTLQTIDRFASRFPGRVAVLHSRLSPGEKFDEWRRIKRGDFDVVIGPRSALFAPQPDLGLIVLDEEHDWNYKQEEHAPRYHSRDVALKMSELWGATVVLGSATPDVVTYHRAERGRYTMLRLEERVARKGILPLPLVETVDMREELRSGNRGIFSRALTEAIRGVLDRKEQAILFLNRRGAATFVQCRNCGHVVRCRRCDVSLTYHLAHEGLLCHRCNRRYKVPTTCPVCQSLRIRLLGAGTEKVEELVKEAFPDARTLRWDRDMDRTKRSGERILHRFLNYEADILIGTQMLAKGLDMPLVTLVGVISADVGLYLPDFRSAERTFQLLCQVAGRAGRSEGTGRAIIQTYSPEHYSVRAASAHDYLAFYQREIAYRRSLGLPPFSRLVRLVYSHPNESACEREAGRLKELISTEKTAEGMAGVEIVGPVPAFVRRVRGRFRWQLIIRGSAPSSVIRNLQLPDGWVVDVDPVNLL
ncbi:MAG: primosomal protein N' [Chloroflexi bacterium]|nr:primosomal protein N' [Chloroflexota bacterium]